MIAEQDLPQICRFCQKPIKKGERYVYNESKKGFSYFHYECGYSKGKVSDSLKVLNVLSAMTEQGIESIDMLRTNKSHNHTHNKKTSRGFTLRGV